jgi:hypothetical protein
MLIAKYSTYRESSLHFLVEDGSNFKQKLYLVYQIVDNSSLSPAFV